MATILVSGAGGNVGRAITAYFRKSGHHVVGIWSPGKRPAELTDLDVEVDLRDEKATAECIDQIILSKGKIDVLICLAGGFEAGTLGETSLSSIERMITINFNTAWNLCNPVVEQMKKYQTSGRIVLIGARPAFEPERGKFMVAYALSKSMVVELSKIINASVKPLNIVCAVIVPGTIDTPQNREYANGADTSGWVSLQELCESVGFLIGPASDKLKEPVLRLYGD